MGKYNESTYMCETFVSRKDKRKQKKIEKKKEKQEYFFKKQDPQLHKHLNSKKMLHSKKPQVPESKEKIN